MRQANHVLASGSQPQKKGNIHVNCEIVAGEWATP